MPKKYGMALGGEDFVEVCARVQKEVFKVNAAGPDYIKEQTFAAIVELCEMVNELDWKGARDGRPKGRQPKLKPGDGVTEKAKEELVDVMFFVCNIAVAMGFTTTEFWEAVSRKLSINVQRRTGLGAN